MKTQENILGTEKISKLIRKYSIPSIISMVVNALYNIVDQIFVGRGVGYLGNGATSIVFPLVMFALSIALMVGDGTSAYLSLKLGEKKEKEACKGVGNGIITGIALSIIFTIISLLFLPNLLNLFGCTDNLRSYALDYGYIIVLGLPFMIIGIILNSLIRADGKPRYAMATMVSGAVLNCILDPILIFVFNMGIKGAAIATIFSQFVTAVLNALYIKNFKSIKLSKKSMKPSKSVVLKLLALGISSFINEISIVALIAVENNMLKKCGEASRFGADIPITVLGIVMKISQILTSVILGIAVGSQPIIGYNYGAQKYDRVRNTFKYVLVLSTCVGIVSFVLFQTIPDKLISIFGSGNDLYMEFACMSFRTYLMFCFVYGLTISSGIFFQAIGKSTKSAIISLSRQILFLIPSMIIFGNIFGIDGLLYSGPFADVIATIICLVMIRLEWKNLGKTKENLQDYVESTETKQKALDKHVVIALTREYGSGGKYIAELLAQKLGIKAYDKEIIEKVAEETGLSVEYIESTEQKRTNSDFINDNSMTNDDELFVKESEIIRRLAKKESCIIVGRCSDYVLKDNKNVIKVFVYNSQEDKINRVTKYFNINKKDALKQVKQINKQRANYYKHYTDQDWGKLENYDICINSDYLGIDAAVELLYKVVQERAK